MSRTHASVRHIEGLAVIELGGDIDGTAEEELTRSYEEAARKDSKSVLLDFRDVGYVNSTGIALIVGLMARARTEGRRMGASGLSDHYREIFEITRLADYMDIYSDKAEALEKGGSSDKGDADA